MRVGIIYPEMPQWPKLRWVFEALQSLNIEVERGHSAADFPRLSQECDVLILGHKGLGGRWPDLKHHFPLRTAVVVSWWFDLIAVAPPLSLANQSYMSADNFRPLMQACDIVFVKEKGMLDEFRELGINAQYLDQGCPVDVRECVRTPKPEWDVLVWGQRYVDRMKDAAVLAEAGFKVAWAGDVTPPKGVERLAWCHPDNLPELCGKASLVLSSDRRNDLAGYWSDRLWMALGMGCAVLRHETPGLRVGPYLRYANQWELVEKAKTILSVRSGDQAATPTWSPDVLALGKEARTWCLANHTLAHRCRELLEKALSVRTAAAQVA